MKNASRPRGVIAAAATPMLKTFAPDVARLAVHCRALLDSGCDGINLLGTTGEATAFSVDQRLLVMHRVVEAGLPVERFMVGTGVCALEDTVRLTRAACELGFAGALALPPFFYPDVSNDGLLAYVDQLIDRVDDPRLALYLYHIPQNTGVPWPLEVVAELKARHPQALVGLKDSAGDLAYSRRIVAAIADFDVFPSSEAALGSAIADGFAGCISATVNLTAKHAQAAWSAQETDAGRAAVKKAGELRAIVAGQPLVAAVKAVLAERNGDAAWARVCPPLRPLAPAAAVSLNEAYARREALA
ncbi:MAG: dihydrodipicolinate synthase family protein [Caldimonas sp.]